MSDNTQVHYKFYYSIDQIEYEIDNMQPWFLSKTKRCLVSIAFLCLSVLSMASLFLNNLGWIFSTVAVIFSCCFIVLSYSVYFCYLSEAEEFLWGVMVRARKDYIECIKEYNRTHAKFTLDLADIRYKKQYLFAWYMLYCPKLFDLMYWRKVKRANMAEYWYKELPWVSRIDTDYRLTSLTWLLAVGSIKGQ